MLKYVRALFCVFVLLLTQLVVSTRVSAEIPVQRNLAQAVTEAKAANLVLVLYIWLADCPYCEKLETEVLQPAVDAGELADVYLIKLPWDDKSLIDFDGRQRSAAEFIESYGVIVTPTILFPGDDGEERAERLIGYQSDEFYWQYLRSAIEESAQWL